MESEIAKMIKDGKITIEKTLSLNPKKAIDPIVHKSEITTTSKQSTQKNKDLKKKSVDFKYF